MFFREMKFYMNLKAQQWKSLFNRLVKRSVLLSLCLPCFVSAETLLDKTVVLALSPFDQHAVVKLPEQEMQALKTGQAVEGVDARLVEVLEDRAVFEEIVLGDNGLKVKETVWVYKAKQGVSRVQRLSKEKPEGLTPQAPPVPNKKVLEGARLEAGNILVDPTVVPRDGEVKAVETKGN